MVESKEYTPTSIEWDELVLLWNRSKAMFESTNVHARIAWTAKTFVESHPEVTPRAAYVWLERNLEVAKGPPPVSDSLPGTVQHDEVTAVHRNLRNTSQ